MGTHVVVHVGDCIEAQLLTLSCQEVVTLRALQGHLCLDLRKLARDVRRRHRARSVEVARTGCGSLTYTWKVWSVGGMVDRQSINALLHKFGARTHDFSSSSQHTLIRLPIPAGPP